MDKIIRKQTENMKRALRLSLDNPGHRHALRLIFNEVKVMNRERRDAA